MKKKRPLIIKVLNKILSYSSWTVIPRKPKITNFINIKQIPGFAELSKKVIEDKKTFFRHDRLYVLWQAVRASSVYNLPIAEVGVYKGGSSYFLCSVLKHINSDSYVYIFDTFEGQVEVDKTIDGGHHAVGVFQHPDATYENVVEYLKEFNNKYIYIREISEKQKKILTI